MEDITFLHPHFFWLFLLLPLIVAWHYLNRKKQTALKMPTIKGFKQNNSIVAKLRPLLFVIRLMALAALIIALARPRELDVNVKNITTEGIDIVIAMDVSISMLARDLKPNRLEALKKIAGEFINDRPNDRIGVVVYSGESYTAAPVTTDHEVVKKAIHSVKYYDNVIKDGTAIGTGLTTAISRLKDSKAKSRVIILLTDGVNNTGLVDPLVAAEIAKRYDIKVYAVGIGTTGFAEQPNGQQTPDRRIIYHYAPVVIDEVLMRDIAKITGGKYFRATDNNSLKAVYNEIDKLEKSEIKDRRFMNYTELFRPFLLIALVLLLIEFIAWRTVYKSII